MNKKFTKHPQSKSSKYVRSDIDVSALKDKVADFLLDYLDSQFSDNIAQVVANKFKDYNIDWCPEDYNGSNPMFVKMNKAIDGMVRSTLNILFANAPSTVVSSRVSSAQYTDGTEYDPEDYEGGYTEWEKIISKPVRDFDGFMTEYTMWYNSFEDKYVFIFGDSDIYYPENADFDWECESYDEAVEWWNDYNGPDDYDEDDIEECFSVKGSTDWMKDARNSGYSIKELMQMYLDETGNSANSDPKSFQKWCKNYFKDDDLEGCSKITSSSYYDSSYQWTATDVVRNMYNSFPEVDFIDERDHGDDVYLYFKYTSKLSGDKLNSLLSYLEGSGLKYRVKNGQLLIIAPEDEDYEEPGDYEEWGDSPVDECQSITSSDDENLKPFIVRFGWDHGGPENGPVYGYGEDVVYALSEDDACSRWESENQEEISGFNSGEYGGYEGCFARPATDEDLKAMEEEDQFWENLYNEYEFRDGGMYLIDESTKGIDHRESSRDSRVVVRGNSKIHGSKSDEFMDLGTGMNYWYFTTHGVQPGSVPRGLEILDIIDRPEGSYFLTNRVLTTDALKYYDIKERTPNDINECDDIKAWYVGEPDANNDYLSSANRFKSLIESPDFEDRLNAVIDKYNTSYPVSGDWSTEVEHEQRAISDEFGISMLQAKKIMKDELGFTDDMF